jgi:ER-bound oxygenase mpaB/B'/Rubber oxygenase, catalytic domain
VGTGSMTHVLLDGMSLRGDPVADDVIARHARDTGVVVPADLVRHIAAHMHMAPGERSPAIQEYLDEVPPLPQWADPLRLQRGATFFADHALEIGSALFCGSLPASYASPRGARVLTLTGRMVEGPVRRVTETAQMVLDVMTTDGLEPGTGVGYQDVRRVRLMHAAVRHFISEDPSVPHSASLPVPAHGWCDGWGTPINQEDLLGALLTFTVSVFDVLDKLGVEYDPLELEGYLHRWCVVASLLGLEDELVPRNRREAEEAARLIRFRQDDPSRDGRELTRALVTALEQSLPFTPFRGLIGATVRWYVGDDVANLLGVQRTPWSWLLEGPLRTVSEVAHVDERRGRLVQGCMRRIGGEAVLGFLEANRGGGRPSFSVPEELTPTFSRSPGRFRF